MKQNPKNKENNNDIPFNVLFPHHQINANSIIQLFFVKETCGLIQDCTARSQCEHLFRSSLVGDTC